MAKKKRKFHSIVIHPNRYLIWALAVALIVAAALVSYIYISNIVFDSTLSSADISYWHTYRDLNLSFRYPAEWLIDPGTGYVGFGPKNQDAFLVYTYSTPSDPAYESYAKQAGSRPITIDGLPGIRIADTGKNSERVAFVKSSTRLYEFRGTTPYFDQILQTVKFLKK